MRRLPLFPTCFAVAVTVAAACTPDFDNASKVKDLRVLAVAAEPPEIMFNLPPEFGDCALPASLNDPSLLVRVLASLPPLRFRLHALVVDPSRQGQRIRYTVRACEKTTSGRCNAGFAETVAEGEAVLPTLSGPVALDPTRDAAGLYEGTTFAVDVQLTPAIVQRAFERDRFRGFGGLPVQLEVRIEAEGGPYPVVYAARDVAIVPRDAAARTQNENPRFTALAIPYAESWPADFVAEMPWGASLETRPRFGAADEKPPTFTVCRFDGRPETVDEERYIELFTTEGSFDPGSVGFNRSTPFSSPADALKLETSYDAPSKPLPETSATLWYIAYDGRGGVSFLTRRASFRARAGDEDGEWIPEWDREFNPPPGDEDADAADAE